MTDERTYSEDEVAEIFARAAEVEPTPSSPAVHSSGGGLTLAELQEIGEEVGLERTAVARAATALDGGVGERRLLGMPVGVSRVVPLPRGLTEREWEALVTDLRQTFRAPGKVVREGGLRRWSNGNLHAFVETTADGHRLRLQTTKGNARPRLMVGGALLAVSLVLTVVAMAAGTAEPGSLLVVALIGGALAGSTVLELPGWARKRREQMAAVSGRLMDRLSLPATRSDQDDDAPRDAG